jgi:hypothetical protein
VFAERRKENANLEHSPTAVVCGEGPDDGEDTSLEVVTGAAFVLLGVAVMGVEFPDRGCRALRDVEDDVRLSLRGVLGVFGRSFALSFGTTCCFVRDLRL